MEKFKAPNPCLLFFIVVVSFTILTTPGKAETTTIHKEDTRNEGKNARLSGSLPGGTPINNVPFAKPVGNNGKQFQLGYQQQQDPNYPQQGINQPLTGFSPPFSATNQPYSGFNQPFSNTNQPFGGTNQAGSMDYAAFGNGVPTEMACIQGIALLCILTLMVCFGF
ncbi:SKU5 similar 18 [Hibiscus syriacus]|uniref:SKU5 similar 18 n=1 Tax=Hibiscus syriacus TaxID=106335 RepID=A0A6A3CIS0_HIBSY|nr:uncharacterized protein LOC120185448 [Hibiscus syriacus]KAE8729053.1 SKU5 similar 18 [Hibiscus syriacus]